MPSLPTKKIRTYTFIKVDSMYLIPSEGYCICAPRALWKDGRFIGTMVKLVVYDDDPNFQPFAPGVNTQIKVPEREFEFEYVPRTDGG